MKQNSASQTQEHVQKSTPRTRTVHDQYGTSYRLTNKLGEGGQGVVCTTERPSVLVKVFNDKHDEKRQRWVNQINWILRQELDGLRIARPMALIEKPVPGYVMELMDGLEPLQTALAASHRALQQGKGLQGFLTTGGLSRRLALLRELARTLAGLHARGFAYGDLSPVNVFVSQSVEHHQVWLIDCDNLCATERLGHGHVHTPGYAAPEVVRGERGVNSLTDAWSFAVIALELVSHCHPFKGAAVLETEPEQEERALRGELPWIHHPDDDSNAAGEGIPLDMVATPRMQALFEACFDAGRDDPLQRPSLAEWADALDAAWALTLGCAECSSGFFWNDEHQCPFCDHVQPDTHALKLAHAYHCPDEGADAVRLPTGDEQVLDRGRSVPLHLAPAGTAWYREAPRVCTLELDAEGLLIAPEPGASVTLRCEDDGREVEIKRRQRLRFDRRTEARLDLHLHHPQAAELRPVWRFVW